MRRSLAPWLLIGLSACGGCETESELLDGTTPAGDGGSRDASADAGADGGARDGTTTDLGFRDIGLGDAEDFDAGFDGGGPVDSGVFDAGFVLDAGPRGTCTSSADCNGRECLAVPDDARGWRTCAEGERMEVSACDDPNTLGCCSSAECTAGSNGACYEGPLWYCGGAIPPNQNDCVYDECQSDAQCTAMPDGICVPRRAFGELGKVCSYGDCRFDEDCANRAGGRCMPFFSPCNGRFASFHCTYTDSECRSDADCPDAFNYCAQGTNGVTMCIEFVPPP